jgi:hypothetical protein
MCTSKAVSFMASAVLGLTLLFSGTVKAEDSGNCEGACFPESRRSVAFPGDAKRPKISSKAGSSTGLKKGHDYDASSREFTRMAIRQGTRPHGDLERSRAFPGADPYLKGLYGRDDVTKKFRALQERQTRDPHGTGGSQGSARPEN